ncbi:hypothetical protein CHH28_01250 [Bacterioplanes sanyensis]|uniref:Acyl-CoA dehydrogenase n=1 Tax=Bacterioplanes sanyensis TaxID=1249553 RepID=A0A222FF59_9GAMM|nr:hypothetical protein [Bacterioplanes sanyensis]ASP37389.1 hypothetical protein CHH28_01250 [Bacterioplanes sanyensis]
MISVTDLDALRAHLPSASGETAVLAWQLGQQADSIASAFLLGYQLALRQVDNGLQAGELAAFCVSEKGLASLSAMSCSVANGRLNGQKSHVMLMQPIALDWLYVLARQHEDLVLVKVAAQAQGIQPQAPLPQPFVPQVSHCPLVFDQVVIEDDFFLSDAHQRANKPFRYWEDVHVTLAVAGWLFKRVDNGQAVLEACERLIDHFAAQPERYDAAGLDAVEQCLQQMSDMANQLTEESERQQWQRDQAIMLLSSRARQALRKQFSAR